MVSCEPGRADNSAGEVLLPIQCLVHPVSIFVGNFVREEHGPGSIRSVGQPHTAADRSTYWRSDCGAVRESRLSRSLLRSDDKVDTIGKLKEGAKIEDAVKLA
jgi:hypothetical protein